MKKLVAFILYVFISIISIISCFAYHDDITNFKILYVYDGDTIYIDIPDYPSLFGKHIGVRLRGINAPEMKSKKDWDEIKKIENKLAAIRAKEMLEYILNNSKHLKLIHVGRCKYFRILADIEADGVIVSDILIKMGLAVSFMTE